jgi:uncharacterized protein with PQ loop repeat
VKVWSNPEWVARTPIITTLLLEAANVQQLFRMWTEGTAKGQSMTAWISVNVALLLWLNFYRVITPNAKWAIRGTAFGVVMNAAVILTVIFFRYIRGE